MESLMQTTSYIRWRINIQGRHIKSNNKLDATQLNIERI